MPREIYKYNDGFNDVWEDPAEIDYRMAKASEDLDMEVINQWLTIPIDDNGNPDEGKMSSGSQKNFVEACHRILPVVRAGFNVKAFDRTTGQGLTTNELLSLYAGYLEWQVDLKKNTGELPIDATVTDSPAISSETLPAPSTQSPGNQLPNVSTGSTSTPDASRPSRVPSSTGPTSIFTPSASISTMRSRTP